MGTTNLLYVNGSANTNIYSERLIQKLSLNLL